tara:strand:- start:852 stop:1049 length:198 start_codon:yes stop_codon:yes gene_type:complete
MLDLKLSHKRSIGSPFKLTSSLKPETANSIKDTLSSLFGISGEELRATAGINSPEKRLAFLLKTR